MALGVGLLLAALAGMNAVGTQNQRYAWLNTAVVPAADASATDAMLWQVRRDYYHGRSIGRVEIAALGPGAPVPPGMPRLPGPGSTTPRRPWTRCCGPRRPPNSATGFPVTRSASSAGTRCRRPTRC
ncbi:hypothetical protein [Micromonospora zhanjiangensis]